MAFQRYFYTGIGESEGPRHFYRRSEIGRKYQKLSGTGDYDQTAGPFQRQQNRQNPLGIGRVQGHNIIMI